MSWTQKQYDDALAWIGVAPQPVPTLLEYVQLAGAVAVQKPIAPQVFTQPVPPAFRDFYMQPRVAYVGLESHFTRERYDRTQFDLTLTADSGTQWLHAVVPPSGAIVALQAAMYQLLIDGVPRGSVKPAGAMRAPLPYVLGAELDGPHVVQILAFDAGGNPIQPPGEWYPAFGINIDRQGKAKDHPLEWAQSADFEWTHGHLEHVLALVPKVPVRAEPKLLRVTPFTPFTDPKTQLFRDDYAPQKKSGNYYYPVTTLRGVRTRSNRQGYFVDGYSQRRPYLPIMDGEFGEATYFFTTFLEWGRNNKLRGHSPFSWWEVDSTGKKHTFMGWRHKWAPYWQDADIPPPGPITPTTERFGHPALELVGADAWADQSIPINQRFAWKSWFSFFDPQTTQVDPNSPLVGDPPEHSHPTDIVGYTTDGHGYMLKVEFDHTLPPDVPRVPKRITRHFPLVDPFQGARWGNFIAIAERSAHRISLWDFRAGVKVRDVLSNPKGTGSLDVMSDQWIGPKLDGPLGGAYEGIAIMDDWLYYTSKGMYGDVWRIHMVSGVQEFCVPVPIFAPGQTHFVQLAVSDGTFGPRHTLFSWTFDNQYYGRPKAWLPIAGKDRLGRVCTHTNETEIRTGVWVNAASWDWQGYGYDQTYGRTRNSIVGVYPMGVTVGKGGLAVGGTDGSLQVFRAAEASDPPAPNAAQINKGHAEWLAMHGDELHGHFGFGGRPLPWGKTLNIDAFLLAQGHKP